MQTIHIRFNEADTHRPTAVRFNVTGPDGAVFAPFGRSVEFPIGRGEAVGGQVRLGGECWYYVDGSCEIQLPSGVPLRVRAAKGPEYTPLDQTVTLGPGQMALRFTIARWSDLRAAGWYSGDSQVQRISPHTALLEAAGEDLDVVNLLAAPSAMLASDGNTYFPCTDLLAFSGQSPALEADGRTVVVNTLNVHPVLGRVGLLHSHRPVFPLTFGGPEETDDWSLCDWCDQCHRKGGLTVWVDSFRSDGGLVGGEALAALLLGKIDAIEFDGSARSQPFLPWVYRLWNIGSRTPLVGGSGKESNSQTLGWPRTYARISEGEPFTYKAWVEAVRGGRTFVTNGPLLSLDMAGHGPGQLLDLTEEEVFARAAAINNTTFDKLEIVANGNPIATAIAIDKGAYWAAEIEMPFAPSESCWLAARVVGTSQGGPSFAHTSPVAIHVNGRPCPRRETDLIPLRALIEETVQWIQTRGRFANPRSRQHLLDRCGEACAILADAGASG